MAIISTKDQIKRSVEAASRGRQTVLFTPAGQIAVMNIFTPENTQDLVPGVGTGVHPAFIVNGRTVSALLVGTFSGVVSGGECTSQAMSTIGSGDYFAAANTINGMGKNWHMMNYAEHSFFKMKALQLGYKPKGNTATSNDEMVGWDVLDRAAYGQRADGLAAGTVLASNGNRNTTILTGSGPVGFRHDGTYNGVSDIVGNGFTYLPGIRFVGNVESGYEVQVLDGAYLTNFTGTPLSLTYDGIGDWKAIDASTGTNINPTFSGSLANGNYLPTTANSVKMYPSTATSTATLGTTGYHLPLIGATSGAGLGFNLAIRSGLGSGATARMRLIGALPHAVIASGTSPLAGTNEALTMFPTSGANCYILTAPPAGMFGMRLTSSEYMSRPQCFRVCSYIE